jgi:2-amino-4-hydroxy-6-hydroxymethyldihydropteridine diphosphokinase
VPKVAIALGTNLGDRRAAIAFAVARLSDVLSNVTVSSTVETEPEGEGFEGQPLFLNAVLVGDTALGPRELLDFLLATEHAYGRQRLSPRAARTLDLDLVLYGGEVIEEADLRVPHPRFRERVFVLGPLAEVAPDWPDPVTGLRARELLKALLRDVKPAGSRR